MVKSRYRGNPDQANRLYAARRDAGFESGRAAALNVGISETKLRAHETAEIAIGSADFQRYAEAFKVHPEWLRSGRGPGPEVDTARAAKLKIRSGEVVRRDVPLPQTAAARLRLARRLAGYASVTEAAERHGWTRSRLSAHETGQNKISADHAREYAESFNVQPRWLATGEGPSGYPPQIHGALEKLLALHELAESEARQQLPFVKPRDKTPAFPRHVRAEKIQIPKITKLKRNLMLLGEYDGVELAAFASGHPLHRKIAPLFEWGFPEGYIQKVLKADPESSFIIAMSNSDRRYDLAPGDRILIDGGDREPREEGVFAVVHGGDIRLERAQDLSKVQSERAFARYFVLGRWKGRIGLP